MAWRTVATVLIVVFAIALAQLLLAAPLVSVTDSLNETGDYENDHFDGNQVITDLPGTWFNMGLIAIFGLLTWGLARILRRELTRRGGL